MNNFFSKISTQEKIIFIKNLAVMIKAGIPILDSLRMLQAQSKSESMIQILTQISEDVAGGHSLASSLQKFNTVFDDFIVNLIKVGEISGILYQNLNYLAEELKKKQELKRKVLGAFIYPIIIMVATFSITSFLVIYIFPKILPVLKGLKGELPWTTKALIFLSDTFVNYGYLILGVTISIIILGWLIMKIENVRFMSHKLLLYLPLIGDMSRDYNIANFCRILAMLLKSDVKVVEALSITADTTNNLIYRKEFQQISHGISRGEEIFKYMEKNPHLFPLMLSQLIAIGESTGNLNDTLVYLSEFYEAKFDDTVKTLSVVLEPLLMVAMGTIVGFVAISIITPIYAITQNLTR